MTEFVSDALLLAFLVLLLALFLYAMGRVLISSTIAQPFVFGLFSAGS